MVLGAKQVSGTVKFLVEFFKYKVIFAITFGLLFSALTTLLIGLFGNLIIQDKNGFLGLAVNAASSASEILAAFFIFFLAVYGGAIYFAIRKQGEDYLDPIRQHLEGTWSFIINTWKYEGKGEWGTDRVNFNVDVIVQETNRKLLARMRQVASDIFEDNVYETTVIHVETKQGSDFELYLLFDTEQHLKEEIAKDYGNPSVNSKSLYILRFSYQKGVPVSAMKGKWFDLDNVIYRLLVKTGPKAGKSEALKAALNHGIFNFSGDVNAERSVG